MIIFVKNNNPQEELVGIDRFRKIQCQYINGIKIKIRNQFNPKHTDRNFHKDPLNQGISHDHVVHTSDYEKQVDYFLRLVERLED